MPPGARHKTQRNGRAVPSPSPIHHLARGTATPMDVIEAEGLVKIYKSRKSEVRALDGVVHNSDTAKKLMEEMKGSGFRVARKRKAGSE